jgi:NAD(P)-dependent dehydrogenase (short-subunit alcohol dehydrogenase family)
MFRVVHCRFPKQKGRLEMANPGGKKVALVTGGGSGIGRATALAFARRGEKVIIGDVSLAAADETSSRIKELGGDSLAVACDVSKTADVKSLVDITIATYGRLDFAFNNAGVSGGVAPMTDWSEEIWDRTCDINLKGVWLCMKYEIPEMLRQGKGAIVNSSSISGLVGCPGLSGYTASKHGVIGITKCVALEYVKKGIRVNAICPASIRTPLTEQVIEDHPEMESFLESAQPIGRMGTAEEVAATVVWLCSEESAYLTGIALPIDGGTSAQ